MAVAVAMLTVALGLNPLVLAGTASADGSGCIDGIDVVTGGPCPTTDAPAPLLSPYIDGGDGIYEATAAQYASLEDLENQAVLNTVADHGLPSSDAAAALTWGRDEALGELWNLIVTAINTSACSSGQTPGDGCQTVDQQNAVAWLTAVDQREAVQAAEDAGLEYIKWAGFDTPSGYQEELNNNPSQGQLTTYFGQGFNDPGPQPYSDPVTSCPQGLTCATDPVNNQLYGEGFCGYQPPSEDAGSYSDANNEECYGPCLLSGVGGSCTPFGPSYDQLVKWGADDVDNQLFNNPGAVQAVDDVAIGLGFGAAGVASVAGLTAAAIAAYFSATGVVTTFFTSAGATTLYTASVASAVTSGLATVTGIFALTIVLAAIITGAIYSVDFFNAADVPSQLATLITDAETTPPNLASMLGSSDEMAGLLALLVGATLSDGSPPTATTCDNSNDNNNGVSGINGVQQNTLCLNAPPIPGPSPDTDYEFEVQLNNGTAQSPSLGPPIYSGTINLDDTVDSDTAAVSTSGNWFVEQIISSTGSSTVQSLHLHYTDWNGNGQEVWLADYPGVGPEFLDVPDADAAGITPSCLSNATCAVTTTIHFIGTDGNDYAATITPPQVPSAPQVKAPPPVDGSPVQLQASATSPLGLPLTYTWQIQDKPLDPSCLSFSGGPPCPPPVDVSGNPVTYTFPASGQFAITVTATDSAGLSTTSTSTINVLPVPPQIQLQPPCNPFAPVSSGYQIICLDNTNVVDMLPGTATTVGGDIVHAGSEDLESLAVNWGDGTPVESAQYAGPCIPVDNCGPNILFGAPFTLPANADGDSQYLPFSTTHTYANPGVYTVTLTLTEQDGGYGSQTTAQTETETVLGGTQTSLSSSAQTAVYGQLVQMTATVTPTPVWAESPTGSVTFYDGATKMGTVTLNAADQATLNTTSLAVGSNQSITADYSGDNNFQGSNSPVLLQTVNQAGTNTSLSAAPSPSVWGQQVTFTAQVSAAAPASGTPTGTVEFLEGANEAAGCGIVTLATSTVTGVQTASCTTSALSVAGHSVTAVYSGDGNFVGTTSAPWSQTVSKASSSTVLSTSNGVITSGQAVTFSANVAAAPPGAGTPTGTVTFYDGTKSLGPVSLNASDQAALATSTLAVGTHSITATYGGDGHFTGSTTSAVTEYVNTNLTKFPKTASGAYNLSLDNLSGGYFVNAQLVNALLVGSNLAGAVFLGANLTGASILLTNAPGANFTGAVLTNADASLSDLDGANFTGATLIGTLLVGDGLENAIFVGANLTGANLSLSNASGANFADADMKNVNASLANMDGANFTGATLAGANLTGTNLSAANFTGANLTGATVTKATTVSGAIWSNTICPDGTNSNKDGGTCASHL